MARCDLQATLTVLLASGVPEMGNAAPSWGEEESTPSPLSDSKSLI
jgi:hypothetical protein